MLDGDFSKVAFSNVTKSTDEIFDAHSYPNPQLGQLATVFNFYSLGPTKWRFSNKTDLASGKFSNLSFNLQVLRNVFLKVEGEQLTAEFAKNLTENCRASVLTSTTTTTSGGNASFEHNELKFPEVILEARNSADTFHAQYAFEKDVKHTLSGSAKFTQFEGKYGTATMASKLDLNSLKGALGPRFSLKAEVQDKTKDSTCQGTFINGKSIDLCLTKRLHQPSTVAGLVSWQATNLHFRNGYNFINGNFSSSLSVESEDMVLFNNPHFQILDKFRFAIDLKTLEYRQFGEKNVTDGLRLRYGLKSRLSDDFFSQIRLGGMVEFTL